MWDALSLQEITHEAGFSSGDDKNVTIRKEVGRGRHTTVLAPQRAGQMCVAIVIHDMWARAIPNTTAPSLGRSLSATSRRVVVVAQIAPATSYPATTSLYAPISTSWRTLA